MIIVEYFVLDIMHALSLRSNVILASSIAAPLFISFYLSDAALLIMFRILSYIALFNAIIILTVPLFTSKRGALDSTTAWNALVTFATSASYGFISNNKSSLQQFLREG